VTKKKKNAALMSEKEKELMSKLLNRVEQNAQKLEEREDMIADDQSVSSEHGSDSQEEQEEVLMGQL
jgi:PHD/YefM family antitoxin component YafN of YafNO toxin-antitoxin module